MIPRRFFVFIDLVTLWVAFVIAHKAWPQLYHLPKSAGFSAAVQPETIAALQPASEPPWVFVVFALSTVLAFSSAKGYSPLLRQSLTRVVASCLFAPTAATAALTTALFTFRRFGWSRLLLFSITAASVTCLLVVRLSLRSYFQLRRASGFYAKHVVLVGQTEVVDSVSRYFDASVSKKEYKVLGYLKVAGEAQTSDAQSLQENSRVPVLGDVNQLGELLIQLPIDEVIAVQCDSGAEWMRDVIENCDAMGVLLRIVPEGLLAGKMKVLQTLYPFQALNFPAVILAPPHFDSDALFFKRLVDIVVAVVMLALLSPVFLIIAIVIKLTDRRLPILYRWNVVGRNGVRFKGFKFTTMYPDAEERRKDLVDQNEMSGPVFKMKHDPRVTPVGRVLRKYSLNELPQLWSVLKGDMSLVGPRPAFAHELERYEFWQKRKLSIRPGMTCLWQVRGRNKISNFDDWVKMDLEYIDKWSLWLDFKILLRTVWAVLAGTGS